ncbi:MAG: right-handed parallel beta-helix repeat-containing protein, partial [Methanobrevibacter sp.]|nr:right-handed parallel beta-helix repeat-containing protein [Methanobrevibacter sp.]
FSPFGFAGRTGSALCKENTITYNELIGFCNLPMSIIIQGIHANNEHTLIAHNTIYKGSYGINIVGDNSLIYNNTVNNSAIGIFLSGNNASIVENNVFGTSQKTGIFISGGDNEDAVAKGNNITFTDVSEALSVSNNAEAYNNIINVANYGVGVRVSSNRSYIHDNKIKTSGDDAVVFLASNMVLDNNIIVTNSRGVSISTTGLNRYYNSTISNNKITSDSYGIYIEGLVYNTTISSNIIETNASSGIFKDISDEESDSNSDNIINGIIHDSTALIIDDDNFYDYFDENGYFDYEFEKGKSNTVFLTFISNKNLIFDEKINVISNKMDNLLYNVTITLQGDASGSLIRDFNFMNFNKEAVILNDVSDVNVGFNNVTAIFDKKINSAVGIYVVGIGEDNIISGNNIYLNSKSNYTYGISISSYNPYTYLYNRQFSTGFTISNNNIILITSGMAEAIFSDSIVESNIIDNTINIISDSDAYGIAAVNVIGKLYSWNITSNEIVIHSKKMAYLIENHMSYDMIIENNYFYGESNGVYSIATYMSENILINNNVFDIISGNLSNVEYDLDVIKPGNAAIYLASRNSAVNITNNTFHTDVVPIKYDDVELVNITVNSHVIDDDNYLVYFNNGVINSTIVKNGDVLLLANLTKTKELNVNIPVNITQFKGFNPSVYIILSQGSDNSSILATSFVNSSIALNNVSSIYIINNTFDSNGDVISIIESFGNYLINNTFNNGVNVIGIDNSYLNYIENNNFNINQSVDVNVIIINNSHNISVKNNNFTGIANDLVFIGAFNSTENNITDNVMVGNASDIFGIYLSNSSHNSIELNNIQLNGNSTITNQAAIYIADNSAFNEITQNFIVSHSKNADDYAVVILSDEILSNNVHFNYLISSNGSKRANHAVLSSYLIEQNTPYEIYVSDDGSDISGDGSESNPFATLSYALKNSLNHVIIKIKKGTFVEWGFNIDKNITIIALTPNVVINANYNQLFNISENGMLTIDGLSIKNGFDENGGSLFINNGTLVINNSHLFNSSSYYDNSHPEFVDVDENHADSYDCRDSGIGGAILNYGNLMINNSLIYDNFAHIGGAIADFGKTLINSSVIYSNQAIHGGAIFTDSKTPLSVNNTLFLDNMAFISMDYCMVRKSVSSWSIDNGYGYTYRSLCNLQTGAGGAI